ncbi:MAG: ATP-binding cassette domain-containing protein [Leptospira sp.]|nr:ATP-binding cassette domain-containing protein [Leptospira sp.]
MIELTNISFIRNEIHILKNVNVTIQQGEHWVILGKNGSGKTTLINILYGMLWPSSGHVSAFGETYGEIPLKEIQSRIGILQSSYQEERLQRNLTVEDIVGSGLTSTIGIYRDFTGIESGIIAENLKDSGWYSRKSELYSKLSSGEKKKILLLRSLISAPEILILDEPCSSLDISAREDFLLLLKKEKEKRNLTSILITHRIDEIPEFYSHILMLKDGEVFASGPIENLMNDENLSGLFEKKIKVAMADGRYAALATGNF